MVQHLLVRAVEQELLDFFAGWLYLAFIPLLFHLCLTGPFSF